MAKGQMRPTKEKRKPKKDIKDKAKASVAQPRFSTTPVHVGQTSNPGKK